jgi:EAL domain-containing protein (putative c-di-GMP-specific phosphodiesterase class I)
LPIDALKIDRSFVREIGRDAEGKAIINAIIALGRALDLTVVAEGVETETQAGLLTDMGCDLAQGFHFARPLRADAALGYLVASGPLVPSQRVG